MPAQAHGTNQYESGYAAPSRFSEQGEHESAQHEEKADRESARVEQVERTVEYSLSPCLAELGWVTRVKVWEKCKGAVREKYRQRSDAAQPIQG